MVIPANNPFPQSRGSFIVPVVPPDTDPDEGEVVTTCIGTDWMPYVLGALQQLTLPSTWEGDEATVQLAQERAQLLLSLVANPECVPVGECPYDIRFDVGIGIVQMSPDGGTTWLDAPYLDPRDINQFPPLTGMDADCDAAARMTAAIQEISAAIVDALNGGAIAADIGALIISWLGIFGGFSVLLALAVDAAAVVVSAGYVALQAAYSSMDWDEFLCELSCRVNSEGQIHASTLQDFEDNYVSTLTGDQRTLINIALLIAGVGGLNDFGAYRTETGDCSGCAACNWLLEITPDNAHGLPFEFVAFDIVNCTNVLNWQGKRGVVGAQGGVNVFNWTLTGGTRGVQVKVHFILPVGSTLTLAELLPQIGGGSGAWVYKLYVDGSPVYCLANGAGGSYVGIPSTTLLTGDGLPHDLLATLDLNGAGREVWITSLKIGGAGTAAYF